MLADNEWSNMFDEQDEAAFSAMVNTSDLESVGTLLAQEKQTMQPKSYNVHFFKQGLDAPKNGRWFAYMQTEIIIGNLVPEREYEDFADLLHRLLAVVKPDGSFYYVRHPDEIAVCFDLERPAMVYVSEARAHSLIGD